MKKKIIIICLLTAVIIAGIMFYKFAAGNDIRNKTYDYLETKGYTEDDIADIEIKHSFINKILSYNEWRIFVEFESTPNVIFAFTYRNNEIIKQGVSSTPMLDKDEISEYDNKFNNGELKK